MTEMDKEFANAMEGVEPIRQKQRAQLTTNTPSEESIVARRNAAQNLERGTASDPLASTHVEKLDAHAILEFRRPGVQHGVYKQFRLGRYPLVARLDLHRMNLERARLAVYQFVRDCLDNDIRCGLIIHGKAEGRQEAAVLKSHIAHWLPQIPEVLAFHSAQKQHGGSGSCYVLLKKSQKKRQENLERHQKRSQ